MTSPPADPVLAIEDLTLEFPAGSSTVRALDGVSLVVQPREILGLIGQTGSGKSLTLLSVMGLVPPPGRLTGGSIRYDGRQLTTLDPEAYRRLRGREIGIVVQNAKSALNPLARVGTQMRNVYASHTERRGRALDQHARAMLTKVGFRDVDRVFAAYPHELSGGMAQRVLIAIALGSSPRLVMVDEPTSGLDPTVAVRVMETFRSAVRDAGAAAVVVTHDLGVVARFCDRAVIMSGGRVVDEAPVSHFFDRPAGRHRASLIAAHAWSGSAAERRPLAGAATGEDREA
jgi:ABC-type dipeptide/oligopeptide/nickel transport system ATPase component